MKRNSLLLIGACLLGSCTNAQSELAGHLPQNVTLTSVGLATLLSAPASQSAGDGVPQPANPADDQALRNPDAAASQAAELLHQRLMSAEAGNYIGRHIVRDPVPRFAFQFRRNAEETLARYSTDKRFVARQGGLPPEELQPILDEWFPRLSEHRLVGGGSVQEFDGVVVFDMTVDEPTFKKVAGEQGWAIPERVKLNFAPPPNPQSVDPRLSPLIRIFARSDRLPGAVNQAALRGRIILRDGCFRVADHQEGQEPLVLFDRDAELGLDEENYIVLRDGGPNHSVRIGEPIIWAGPRSANEADAGVKALRAQCGDGAVIPIGAPSTSGVMPRGG